MSKLSHPQPQSLIQLKNTTYIDKSPSKPGTWQSAYVCLEFHDSVLGSFSTLWDFGQTAHPPSVSAFRYKRMGIRRATLQHLPWEFKIKYLKLPIRSLTKNRFKIHGYFIIAIIFWLKKYSIYDFLMHKELLGGSDLSEAGEQEKENKRESDQSKSWERN